MSNEINTSEFIRQRFEAMVLDDRKAWETILATARDVREQRRIARLVSAVIETAIKFRTNDGFWCLEGSGGTEFANAVDALIKARGIQTGE